VIDFLKNPKRISDVARTAEQWVKTAIQAVRDGAEPNPWRTADDETIATEIVRRMDERKQHP
jgi:hypothetical protein